ncbi:MAG: CvpA family protein [Gammaproteobacteria bacterium]
MAWIDVAIIVVILISVLISLLRGFVKEAMSLTGWVLSFWVALTFAGGFSRFLKELVQDPTLRLLTAFVILFVLTLILSVVANFFASQLVKRTGLSGMDRFIGVLFGFLRGVVLVAALTLLASLTTLPQSPWWQASVLLEQFQILAIWLKALLPSDIAGHFVF